MVLFEDVISVALLCISSIFCVGLVIHYFDRRHKNEMEFERKKMENEADTVLMKAKIYADKDLRIASLEQQTYNSLENMNMATGNESIDQYLPLLQVALQNPSILSDLIEKIKPK
jgi:hypothetical protein